jgi:predicted DNA-binding transcriptional regulator AlpA
MTRFLKADGVAEFLNVSVRKLRDDDKAERIPAPVKFGRLKRWDADELRRWCDAGCPARRQWEALKARHVIGSDLTPEV